MGIFDRWKRGGGSGKDGGDGNENDTQQQKEGEVFIRRACEKYPYLKDIGSLPPTISDDEAREFAEDYVALIMQIEPVLETKLPSQQPRDLSWPDLHLYGAYLVLEPWLQNPTIQAHLSTLKASIRAQQAEDDTRRRSEKEMNDTMTAVETSLARAEKLALENPFFRKALEDKLRNALRKISAQNIE